MIKRNLPLMITIGVFVLGYLYCLTQFPGFASTRVICNILTDNAFLGIIAVGMTFVILSGGIDLSVGSVIAFTGVFLAKVIGDFGLSPLLAFPLVLVMGCAFGAFMGLLIDALKIPAFIITLAGMFFLRGVSYLVSEESIPINHPIYDTLSSLAWKIPGGGRLSAMGLLMLAVVVIGIFLAHRTRFGNQVYAIGGNATSANLMGISTRSTTIRIYMLSTGLATLAGIVFSIYTQAGYALAGFMGMLPESNEPMTQELIMVPTPLYYGLGIEWSLLLPLMLVFMITSLETIGDITATSDVSEQPVSGPLYMKRLKGGVLANGLNSFVSAVFNTFPNSCFGQNNGVIQLTGVASRYVGFVVALMLIVLGLFPAVSGFVQHIPEPVLGGATLVMFGTIAASGVRIVSREPLNRRAILIIALSLAVGLGVSQQPLILQFAPEWLKNLLSSGIAAGGITAIVLNLIFPPEKQ